MYACNFIEKLNILCSKANSICIYQCCGSGGSGTFWLSGSGQKPEFLKPDPESGAKLSGPIRNTALFPSKAVYDYKKKTYVPLGSKSAHAVMNSPRWWEPRILESLARSNVWIRIKVIWFIVSSC